MRQKKAKKILVQVKATYDIIGEEFDRTRQNNVEEFEIFKPYLENAANILDLGCGNGRLLRSLHGSAKKSPAATFHYLGIDNNRKMLNLAQKNFPHENFMEGDQLEIPVDDSAMDLIFNIRSFHHLPGEKLRLQALKEMNRVLRPNGILIITVWNLWQRRNLILFAKAVLRSIFTLGNYSWKDLFVPWGKKNKRYYHAFTPLELSNLVTRNGFEIEESCAVRDGNRVPLRQSHDIVIIARKISNA